MSSPAVHDPSLTNPTAPAQRGAVLIEEKALWNAGL
jgi:hypothetical protein